VATPSRPGTAADLVVVQRILLEKSIDCIGLFSPMPIVKARDGIQSMAVGQILEILSDDPASVRT